MAYNWETYYYFRAYKGNSNFYLNREGSGNMAQNQNCSIYKKTGTGVNNDHRLKLVRAYNSNGTLEGCSLRIARDPNYGLNIYGYGGDMTKPANCDFHTVAGNYDDSLIDLLTVDSANNLYRIKLIKHNLFLTPAGNYNNANVTWERETGGNEQIWQLCGSESGSNSIFQYPAAYSRISTYFTGADGHRGVDFVCPEGTPVKAAATGQIIYTRTWTSTQGTSGWASMGNCIYVQHGGSPNLMTVYMHLREINSSYGFVGYQVRAGDIIAYSGSTGKSTGPHLHFGVVAYDGIFPYNDVDAYHKGTYVDPFNYLP